jgi:AcrR family transcriptional regulator
VPGTEDRTLRAEAARVGVTSRRGRRPGHSGTREAILAAAQRQFAELGYDRTSMRSIADQAGVDQRLVAYFFGSKQQLFMAAVELELPPDIAETIPDVFSGSRRTVGSRLARRIVALLEEPRTRAQIVGAVRAAASEPEAARMLKEMRARLMQEIGTPVAEALGDDEVELRIALVHSQFLGLVTARHIIGVEPLTSLDSEQLEAVLGPVLQRLLTGPIATR